MLLVVVSKISCNGGDGGWLCSCGVSKIKLGFCVDEDWSMDLECNYIEEDVSILVMILEFVFSGEIFSCDVVFLGVVVVFGGVFINLFVFSCIIDENGGVFSVI